MRMAEKHKNIVASWKSRQISLKCSEAKEANASPKHGHKRIAKQIGGGSAKPWKFGARDGMTNDGGRKGTLTANPSVIDGIITRAWQNIYNGNAKSIPELVRNFKEKYEHVIYIERKRQQLRR